MRDVDRSRYWQDFPDLGRDRTGADVVLAGLLRYVACELRPFAAKKKGRLRLEPTPLAGMGYGCPRTVSGGTSYAAVEG